MAHIHNNVNTILSPFYGENDGTFNPLRTSQKFVSGLWFTDIHVLLF